MHCRDGVLGELADIVVDPNPSRVSHLVVHAAGGGSVKRLIPYDLVDDAGSRISLRCTLADAHGLAEAQELEYLPSGEGGQTPDPDWEVGVQDVTLVPRHDASVFVDYTPEAEPDIMHIYDRIPRGHVEVRRESSVTTADGHHAGNLEGIVIEGGKLTHLVLRCGHLWHRRTVLIPMSAVGPLHTDEIEVRASRRELQGFSEA